MASGCGQAARHERRRVRDRAEDRRALDQPDLRGRGLRSRRYAGRRPARGGCNAERAHDQGDLDAHAAGQGRDAPAAPRSARRGLPPAERVQRAERASRRRRQEADAEPAERGGRARYGSRTPRSRPNARCRSGSMGSATARAFPRTVTGSRSSGCARTDSARTRTRSGTRPSSLSPRPAVPGRSGVSSSTTRSTGS